MHLSFRIALPLGVALALLAGLQAVLRQSVQQGEMRRIAVARQTEAGSACSRLAARTRREACRAQLSADTAAPAPDALAP